MPRFVPTVVAFHTPIKQAGVALLRHAAFGVEEYQGCLLHELSRESGATALKRRKHAFKALKFAQSL